MKKKSVIFIILMVMTFIFLPLVSAQPPPTTSIVISVDTGVAIDFPNQNVFEQNEAYHFHFHTFNISDGTRLDNTTTNCTFELFDNKGNHLIDDTDLDFLDDEFEINVTGGNFSRLGDYHYLVDCVANGPTGGFISIAFEVTPTGIKLDTGKALVYLILLIGSLLIFSLTLWGSIVLPIKNKRNGLDEVIDVDFLKYAKVSLIFISYTLLVWIINLLIALSNGFILLSQYSGFFTMAFEIMVNILAFPLFILMIIIFFVMGANDLKLKKFLERGINVR